MKLVSYVINSVDIQTINNTSTKPTQVYQCNVSFTFDSGTTFTPSIVVPYTTVASDFSNSITNFVTGYMQDKVNTSVQAPLLPTAIAPLVGSPVVLATPINVTATV